MGKVSEKIRLSIYEYVEGGTLLIGAFFRFFKLSGLPKGVYVDEPPLMYNAYCLANYGVDRYLHKLPIYPQNWYGGQSPLYTYLLAFLYKLGFDSTSIFVLRLPAAIFSVVLMFMLFMTARLLYNDKRIHLLAAITAAFVPYFIMQGRYALDCNLLLSMVTLSVYFLLKYLKSGKTRQLIISGILFGLSLYAYALSYVLLAAFLILTGIYLLVTKKITFKKAVIWAFSVIVVSIPIILFAISLLLRLEPYSFLGVTIAPVSADRMSELSANGMLANALKTFFATLTTDGRAFIAYNPFGTLNYVFLPFVILGMVLSIIDFIKKLIKKEYCVDGIFLFLLLANVLVGGLSDYVIIYRVNSIFLVYFFYLIKGAAFILCRDNLKKVYECAAYALFALCGILFLISYFGKYNEKYPVMVNLAEEAIEYAQGLSDGADIYVD